jgi:hypothetical protein
MQNRGIFPSGGVFSIVGLPLACSKMESDSMDPLAVLSTYTVQISFKSNLMAFFAHL